jgi:hypothetical protein
MINDFNFIVPISDETINKAVSTSKSDRYKNMILEGVASDNSKDVDGETLEPIGYEIDRFLDSGYINYEHLSKKSPKFLIGEPIKAEIKGNKFHIKAKLWENSDVAKATYDKIIEMKEAGSKRRPGWSIEGKALARDPMNPKRITKALITNVALTFSPVNGNTWADISKGIQKEDYVETEYEKKNGDKDYLFEFVKNGKKYQVQRDYTVIEVIDKAMGVEAIKPLIPESLDKKTKILEIKKSIDNVLKYKELGLVSDELMDDVIKKIKLVNK